VGHLGIALKDSVSVHKGLAGIAFGGRGVRSRDGKAWDHRHRRVSVSDGSAPRQRQVNVGVGGRGLESGDCFCQYCCCGRDPRAVAEGGRRTSFIGG